MPKDPVGMEYDSKYTDRDGTTHYTRNQALGTAGGSAHWTDEHDCNPICGHHLAARCSSCSVCMDCDGCYCYED